MKSFLKTLQSLWDRLPDGVRRVIHTAWQVGLATLVTQLLAADSSEDIKAAFVAAGAVMLATLKAAVVGRK